MKYSAVILLFFLHAFAAIPAHGAEGDEIVIQKSEPRVRDSWIYSEIDDWTGKEEYKVEIVVTFIGPKAILAVSTNLSNGQETDTAWTPDWNATTTGSRVYSPSRSYLRFPMKVGDAFESKFDMVARKGSAARTRFEGTTTIVAWEEIQVPAGKFRAVRVETKGTYMRLDVRNSGWFRSTVWYSPEIERWVKSSFEDGYPQPFNKSSSELISFKHAK